MTFTKFQKLGKDLSKYNYDRFTTFVSIFPHNFTEIYYEVEFIKNVGRRWIILSGNNDNGFSIGGILNEAELKKFIKEDLENGCVLYATQGDINDLIFKNSKIPKMHISNARKISKKV